MLDRRQVTEQVSEQLAQQFSQVRTAKIAKIKSRISSGAYRMSSAKIARSLVQEK